MRRHTCTATCTARRVRCPSLSRVYRVLPTPSAVTSPLVRTPVVDSHASFVPLVVESSQSSAKIASPPVALHCTIHSCTHSCTQNCTYLQLRLVTAKNAPPFITRIAFVSSTIMPPAWLLDRAWHCFRAALRSS